MSKEDRYSHLGGDSTGEAADAPVETGAPSDDAVHVTVSDGSGDVHLRIDGEVPTDEVVEAIRRCADADEGTARSSWAHGVRASTRATRSMLAAGTFGMRLGAIGADSMLRPWSETDGDESRRRS
jgi:hypothetical protein